jgi:6-pyruvoyltetrahydropterin/6-carboxytetrahydropterin synthase
MRVILKGAELYEPGSPSVGMLLDFGLISERVRPLLEGALDHHYLNETTGLENPTSEELARWIYNVLYRQLPELHAIEIDETCTSSCHYEP